MTPQLVVEIFGNRVIGPAFTEAEGLAFFGAEGRRLYYHSRLRFQLRGYGNRYRFWG